MEIINLKLHLLLRSQLLIVRLIFDRWAYRANNSSQGQTPKREDFKLDSRNIHGHLKAQADLLTL